MSLQRKKMLPPFQFYKDQGISHCSCPRTVQPERNSQWRRTSILCFGHAGPWMVRIAWILRENFSEPRFLHLLVRRKALKSLTWCLFFVSGSNLFMLDCMFFSAKKFTYPHFIGILFSSSLVFAFIFFHKYFKILVTIAEDHILNSFFLIWLH